MAVTTNITKPKRRSRIRNFSDCNIPAPSSSSRSSHKSEQTPIFRSPPQLAVEGAELDGLRDVVRGNLFAAAQVGDGAGNFQDAVVGAGAEVVFRHGQLQQLAGRLIQFAKGFQFP